MVAIQSKDRFREIHIRSRGGMVAIQSTVWLRGFHSENAAQLENLNPKSFMVKHWASAHSGLDAAPAFKFEVVNRHRDSLARMLHEAL